MGNLQEESVAQKARQLAEQNVSGQVFRMFIIRRVHTAQNINIISRKKFDLITASFQYINKEKNSSHSAIIVCLTLYAGLGNLKGCWNFENVNRQSWM